MARRTRTEQIKGQTGAPHGEGRKPATPAKRAEADEDAETLMRLHAQVKLARKSIRAHLEGLDPAARQRLELMLYSDGPTDLSRPLGDSPGSATLVPRSRRTADVRLRSVASRFLRRTGR